jgi:hypothetical protein
MIANDTWVTNTALSFEKVSQVGAVSVVMTNANNAPRSGTVRVGGQTLAMFMQDKLVWQAACGSPQVTGIDGGFH